MITEEPRDVEISFGNTVYFSCKADGDPIPNIVWLHNRYLHITLSWLQGSEWSQKSVVGDTDELV